MNLRVRCLTCGKEFWVKANSFSCEFDDKSYQERVADGEVCHHVQEGDIYEVVETELNDA